MLIIMLSAISGEVDNVMKERDFKNQLKKMCYLRRSWYRGAKKIKS